MDASPGSPHGDGRHVTIRLKRRNQAPDDASTTVNVQNLKYCRQLAGGEQLNLIKLPRVNPCEGIYRYSFGSATFLLCEGGSAEMDS